MRPADPDIVFVLETADRDGSFVAGSTPEIRDEIARYAVRRWSSSQRRIRAKTSSTEKRIEDLARGLYARGNTSREAAESAIPYGVLMTEYRWLAGRLAEALEASESCT
jgi:hypothetical protein